MVEDRRRLERVRLPNPPAARVGELPGRILDVGLLGAKVETESPLEPGTTHRIRFDWGGEEVVVEGRVTRCEFQALLSEARGERIYFSGFEFIPSDHDSAPALRQLIADEVTRALEAQKANARGAVAELVEDVPFLKTETRSGRVRRAEPPTYVCCRLGSDGTWKKTIISRPAQPVDGFTVRLHNSEEEINRLCRAYQDASPEVRKLLRLCAEMSTLDEHDHLPMYE